MTTPLELREAFLATRVDVEINPDEWLPIDLAVRHLPTPLHLITAWNPANAWTNSHRGLKN